MSRSTARRDGAAALVARSVGGDPAERRRRRLVAAAVAGCAAFALAAVALATYGGGAEAVDCTAGPDGTWACTAFGGPDEAVTLPGPGSGLGAGLAPYVEQSGLRSGVVTAAVLLVVPFAVFAVQVLRLGSAARERRLAALRLQGATTRDLRRIAAAQAWPAALAGSAAGLPAYLALWFLLGVVLPAGWRLLPVPGAAVLLAWPVTVALLTCAAAFAAARAARVASVDALGGSRRRPRPLSRTARIVPVVVLAALAGCLAAVLLGDRGGLEGLFTLMIPVLLVASAVTLGPWLVVAAGRLNVRRRDPVRVLAGRRLLADPRTPGRPAGVLFGVGLAVGFAAQGLADVLAAASEADGGVDDVTFYVGGYAMALAGIALAAVVAAASLVVGAGEQVLDARRPTAALVALGADPTTVRRLVRIQLGAAAVVPAVVGTLVGSMLLPGLLVLGDPDRSRSLAFLGAAALAVAVSAAAAASGAAAAAVLLRRPLADAMSVESLRTA